MKMIFSTIIAVISAVFLFIILWGWYSSNLILKIKGVPIEHNPSGYGLDFEEVSFKTEDGLRLSGWFVPADKSVITVVVCHGWGGNKENVIPATKFLHEKHGVNLLYFDFRNHGESEGSISTLGYKEMLDLKAAIAFIGKEKKEYSKKIGLIGFSMGASTALVTATENEMIKAVVADSPFSDIPDVIVRYAGLFYGIPKFPLVDIGLLFTRIRLGVDLVDYSPVKSISKISPRPVFIIQGETDLRMPVREGILLYEKAGEPKDIWVAEGSDHLNAYRDHAREYEEKIGNFFSRYLKS